MKKNEKLHEKQVFENMRDLVERSAEMYPDRTAYSYKISPRDKEPVKKSFTELRDDIRALTTELLSRGYAGGHCAVIGKFSYSWVRAYFSILSAGAVIVPLDRDWTGADLADTVARANAEYLFIDRDLSDKAEAIKALAGIKEVIFMSGDEGETLDSLVALGKEKFASDSSAYYNAPIDVNKLALLVFTSGTTGKGKGVMLTQNNVLSDMSDVIPYIDFGRTTVGVLPPHHTFGSSVMLVGHMMIGTEIYISGGLKYVAKEFKEVKPEHIILVPLYLETFYRKMQAAIKDQGKEKLVKFMMGLSNLLRKVGIDLRRKFFASLRDAMGGQVKMVITGGAPVNSEIVEFFDNIGISTLNGYGITECAPIIAVNRSMNIVKGSVGQILDIDTVKISEPNEDGEGEICVTGSNVMLGYYNDEQNTADAFDEEGYFKTGDYGKIGKGGALFITGRKKNLIILSNGKNVYPEEIENEFTAVPGLIDIIVYEGQSKRGLAHNAIVAEVYPDYDFMKKNGIEDVYAYMHGFVEEYNKTAVPYKKIAILKIRTEEFPKNTLRKILRFKLDMTID
jgi:long-chain acyl-CoA synthetase